MTRTVEDVARLLLVLAGENPEVPFPRAVPDLMAGLDRGVKGPSIGRLADPGGAYPMKPNILDLCETALGHLEMLGAVVEPLPPPFPAGNIWSSWVTFGTRLNPGGKRALAEDPARRALTKTETIWEIDTGLGRTARKVHEASAIRSRWHAHAARLFDRFDAVPLPSAQVWPFPAERRWPQSINGRAKDPYHRWMEVVVPASRIGLTALSVPVGFGPAGLPMGMRIISRSGNVQACWPSVRPGTGRRNGLSAARLWWQARFRARPVPKGGIMRVLVIGSGSIGRRHHDNLQTLGAASRLVSWREVGIGGALAAMQDAEAVVIATATDIRLPLIKAAVAQGLPMYVEKPLAFRPDEVEAIAELAAPVADRSMLGLMLRYHPAVQVLARSELADVFQFALTIGHDVAQWRQNWRFSDSYAARVEGGGVLLDLCHELDLAACLFPGLEVRRVDSLGHPAFPGVDFASRVSLCRSGLVGDVSMDYLTPLLHRRTMLRGTERMHDFDFAAQSYKVTEGGGPRLLDLPLERNAMFLDAMRDFLALVSGGTTSGNPLMPRLDHCLPSARLVADAWSKRTFIGEIAKEIP